MFTYLWYLSHSLYCFLIKIPWMSCCKSYPLNTFNICNSVEKINKSHISKILTVSCNILTYQMYLLYTIINKPLDFLKYLPYTSASLFTTCVGNYTVCTFLVTSSHNCYVSRISVLSDSRVFIKLCLILVYIL